MVQRYFIKKLAFAVFAALTPHRQPSPQNGLRHFAALPTHHPAGGGDRVCGKGQKIRLNLPNLKNIVRNLTN